MKKRDDYVAINVSNPAMEFISAYIDGDYDKAIELWNTHREEILSAKYNRQPFEYFLVDAHYADYVSATYSYEKLMEIGEKRLRIVKEIDKDHALNFNKQYENRDGSLSYSSVGLALARDDYAFVEYLLDRGGIDYNVVMSPMENEEAKVEAIVSEHTSKYISAKKPDKFTLLYLTGGAFTETRHLFLRRGDFDLDAIAYQKDGKAVSGREFLNEQWEDYVYSQDKFNPLTTKMLDAIVQDPVTGMRWYVGDHDDKLRPYINQLKRRMLNRAKQLKKLPNAEESGSKYDVPESYVDYVDAVNKVKAKFDIAERHESHFRLLNSILNKDEYLSVVLNQEDNDSDKE